MGVAVGAARRAGAASRVGRVPRAAPPRAVADPHCRRCPRGGAGSELPVGLSGTATAALQLARVGSLPRAGARTPRPHAPEIRHARPRLLARVPDGATGPGRPETRRAERVLVPPDRSDQLDDPRGADPQHHRPRRLRRDGLRSDPPRRFPRPARLRAPRSRRRARAPLEVHVRHLPRRARTRCILRRPLPCTRPAPRDPGHRAGRGADGPPVRGVVRRSWTRSRAHLRPRGAHRDPEHVGEAGASGPRIHRPLPPLVRRPDRAGHRRVLSGRLSAPAGRERSRVPAAGWSAGSSRGCSSSSRARRSPEA